MFSPELWLPCSFGLNIRESLIIIFSHGDVAKRPKAAVCKTAIPRFKSGRRLCRGGGKADAGDLKSPGTKSRAGSSPAPGTFRKMLLQRTSKNVFISILIGLIFGSIIGKVLFHVFPESPARKIVFEEIRIGIPQISLNLGIFGFSFSFYFVISIFSVIFALFVIYLLIKL